LKQDILKNLTQLGAFPIIQHVGASPDEFRDFLAAFEPFKDVGINLALKGTYALIITAPEEIELAFLAFFFDHIAQYEATVSPSCKGPVSLSTADFSAHRRTYITEDVGLTRDFIKVFLNGYLQGILDCNFQLLANFRIDLEFRGLLFRRLMFHLHLVSLVSLIDEFSKTHLKKHFSWILLIDLDLKSGKVFIDFRQSV
jgi:hypothetical protein